MKATSGQAARGPILERAIVLAGLFAAGAALAELQQFDDFRGTDTSAENVEWDVSQHANTSVDVSELSVEEPYGLGAAAVGSAEWTCAFDSFYRRMSASDALDVFSSTPAGALIIIR